MSITLKNYSKELPKEIKAQAEKCKVRECDEAEKGSFVAYVDEGDESYDVALEIAKDGTVSAGTCECKSGNTFCKHKVALLTHIAEGKKLKAPVVKARKNESEITTILNELEVNELREWLKKTLEKNKELKLEFLTTFSKKQINYQPADVEKLIKDSIKAICGNKKYIDASQLRKVMTLLEKVLAPIVEHYYANTMDQSAFNNVNTIITNLLDYQYSIMLDSPRIREYITGILDKAILYINNLQEDEAWHQATQFFLDKIDINKRMISDYYLNQIGDIIKSAPIERKNVVVKDLVVRNSTGGLNDRPDRYSLTRAIFWIVDENELLNLYNRYFKVIPDETDYNVKLIQSLIANRDLELAIQYCKDSVKKGYALNINVPIYQLLKEIYKLQNDTENFRKTCELLFPASYNFGDFLAVYDGLKDQKRKEWRTKSVNHAKNAVKNNNMAAQKFLFSLWNHEKDYKEMITNIHTNTLYETIVDYFEPLFAYDATSFITAVLRKLDIGGWGISYSVIREDNSYIPNLFDMMLQKYSDANLISLIEKNGYERSQSKNRILSYTIERLKNFSGKEDE